MTLLTFPNTTIATVVPAPGRPLSVGFLSPHNPYDRRSFSGTAYFAARALAAQQGLELRCLGHHTAPGWLARQLGRPSPQTRYEDCDFQGLDAVVGLVASDLLQRMVQDHPTLPFLHVTDATPAYLRNVYGWSVPASADITEARVAQTAAKVLYSSTVMADRATTDLGLDQLRTAVLPFGVNFESLPRVPPTKPSLKRLELLFIGLDWVRKGGDVAVETLNRLRAAGQDTRLTLIGDCPDRHRAHPHIRTLGFLNKNKRKDAALLSTALSDAHLLILPSRGDCTPMVVTEALAHGTPVVATDTGGIAEMVSTAGQVLPPMAAPQDWANTILAMVADRMAYDFLSDAAFDRGQTALCWTNWARQIALHCHALGLPDLRAGADRNVAIGA